MLDLSDVVKDSNVFNNRLSRLKVSSNDFARFEILAAQVATLREALLNKNGVKSGMPDGDTALSNAYANLAASGKMPLSDLPQAIAEDTRALKMLANGIKLNQARSVGS